MNGTEYIPEADRERAVRSQEPPDNGEERATYGTRLWHDDVRPPPEPAHEWMWAKTNAEAQAILEQQHYHGYTISEISLDHDLGAIPTGEEDPTEVLYLRGTAEETGLHLVEWMIENNRVPPVVRIHSWNPDGAKRMADRLVDAGHGVTVAPFVVP